MLPDIQTIQVAELRYYRTVCFLALTFYTRYGERSVKQSS